MSEEQAAVNKHHELVIPPRPPQWGQQILHSLWESVAVHRLPLQGHGVCGGSGESVGG